MLRNEANCKERDSRPEGSRGLGSIRVALTLPGLIAVADHRIDSCDSDENHIQRFLRPPRRTRFA